MLFSYYSLQIKFLPLLNFMRKKDDKVGKKSAYKKKGKWKKKRARKKFETDSFQLSFLYSYRDDLPENTGKMIAWEWKSPLPVNMRRSQTSVLNLPIAFISSIQKRVQRWRVSWLRPIRPVLAIRSPVHKIWQILPRKCKAFLYSACNSRIQASNHTTLCEIRLSQKKQKPFWCVEELQPLWTCIKETVPRSFVLWYRWDVHILQQEKQINFIADFWLFFLCMLKLNTVK